ncbi:MAG: ABC transporter ATP-binding protein [Proteobacteria bacterium]|nr:MAG: ABC transporter ATP-binding protein [Pseudomonadota bacterium]
MIKLQDLSLQRGGNFLLEQASLTLFDSQKVAIIGANGAGKSSLFKLLLGELSPDQGSLQLPGNSRISHMAQETPHTDKTALNYVLAGDGALEAVQLQLQQAEDSGDMEKISSLHEQLDRIDGYQAKNRAEKLLHGLGFEQGQMDLPVSSFSGGWRIRLNLARALMCPSDILLLDEPTNHLDLDATLWLEKWLNSYPGMLLLISHDRDFIDRVAQIIVHFDQRRLISYTGNYSSFEKQKAERLAQQQAAFEKQQTRKAEIEDFVRRFRAKATKARQAQSRLKELERMEEIAPAHIDSPFHFSFPCSDKMSTPLVSLNQASLGYCPDQPVLGGVRLSILPGTRVGLLGRNGAGKSTLIKSLTDDIPLLAGEKTTGQHLAIGYFAQHQLEALDLKASPFLHIQRLSPQATDQEIRNFLGGFGFTGDDALAPVDTFSGGQKARLALALIAWLKPNVLLLDEPTNHLDLEMRHAMTVALQGFAGAIIVVSHDRHLLKNTVDQFWLVDSGKVTDFDGDLDDYEKWLSGRERPVTPKEARMPSPQSAGDKKRNKRLAAEKRKKISPLKKELEKIEHHISMHQKTAEELEAQLGLEDIYSEGRKEDLKALLQHQAGVRSELDSLEEQWLALSETIEEMESNEDR